MKAKLRLKSNIKGGKPIEVELEVEKLAGSTIYCTALKSWIPEGESAEGRNMTCEFSVTKELVSLL